MPLSRVLEFAHQQGLTLTGLTFNSSEVRPGFAFFALKGVHADGNLFIAAAIAAGAVLIVSAQPEPADCRVPYFQSAGIDQDMADAAYEFYKRPSDQLNIIGITGTKGKTSIAYLAESILRRAGQPCGVLGTINYRINGRILRAAPNTTPAALTLFALLREMVQQKAKFLVMEVSSHALELQRVRHIQFNTAIFTNLQRDHLDFHQTFENYFEAKKKLFANLVSTDNPKPARLAVLNADDPYAQRLLKWINGRVKVVTFGLDSACDYRATDVQESLDGTLFNLNGRPAQICLLGRHNVYNALAAYVACVENGIAEQTALQGLLDLPGVPGRMQRIDEGQPFYVFVDFAYTDESLQRAYETVAHFKQGRIITVFGCGGDRDRTKRPLMGLTACTHSDLVFLTNDNPRDEAPEQIFNDIVQGMAGYTNVETVPDRAEAIARALAAAQPQDIVIIAGKGHEDYQLIAGKKSHFSDIETVTEILKGKK